MSEQENSTDTAITPQHDQLLEYMRDKHTPRVFTSEMLARSGKISGLVKQFMEPLIASRVVTRFIENGQYTYTLTDELAKSVEMVKTPFNKKHNLNADQARVVRERILELLNRPENKDGMTFRQIIDTLPEYSMTSLDAAMTATVLVNKGKLGVVNIKNPQLEDGKVRVGRAIVKKYFLRTPENAHIPNDEPYYKYKEMRQQTNVQPLPIVEAQELDELPELPNDPNDHVHFFAVDSDRCIRCGTSRLGESEVAQSTIPELPAPIVKQPEPEQVVHRATETITEAAMKFAWDNQGSNDLRAFVEWYGREYGR
jgi:hypothetical protein